MRIKKFRILCPIVIMTVKCENLILGKHIKALAKPILSF